MTGVSSVPTRGKISIACRMRSGLPGDVSGSMSNAEAVWAAMIRAAMRIDVCAGFIGRWSILLYRLEETLSYREKPEGVGVGGGKWSFGC